MYGTHGTGRCPILYVGNIWSFFRRMLDAELKGTRPLQIWGNLSQGGHTPHRQGPEKTAEFRETFFRSEEGAVGNNEKRAPGVLFSYH